VAVIALSLCQANMAVLSKEADFNAIQC